MSFWKDRLCLVTGADGFIGSHLVEGLLERGARVRAFCLYNSFGSWGWLDESPERSNPKLEVAMGDLCDAGRVAQAVDGVDTVFHLGALIAIPYSYDAPESYLRTNVSGTQNVLSAALRSKVRRVVHTSTSEVYGSAQIAPIPETHPVHPQSPYAASKASADHFVSSYVDSFGLKAVTLRPFNTFGPRQSARAIIPSVLSQLLGGVSELKVGNLAPTRDLNYVRNTVDAFLAIAESDRIKLGDVYNAGSGREISIGDLIRMLAQASGRGDVPLVVDPARLRPDQSEVMRLLADFNKLKTATGWTPQVSLEQGVELTVAWMRENLSRFKVGREQR